MTYLLRSTRFRLAACALAIGLGLVAAPVLRAEDHPDAPAAEKADDHHGAGAEGGGHGGHEAGGENLPGLNPFDDFKADLPLWSLITFGLFFLILAKFAWGPLRDALDGRESRIRQHIADAESNRVKSEALLKDYETRLAKAHDEVKAILAEARKDADHAKQDILATADKESAAMRQRAVGDIERARDQALGELFDFVSKNVVQATEQVVGRSLTGADQERLVKEALASLDLRKN